MICVKFGYEVLPASDSVLSQLESGQPSAGAARTDEEPTMYPFGTARGEGRALTSGHGGATQLDGWAAGLIAVQFRAAEARRARWRRCGGGGRSACWCSSR